MKDNPLLKRHILFTVFGTLLTIAGMIFNSSPTLVIGILQLAFGIFGIVVFRTPGSDTGREIHAENPTEEKPAEKKNPELEKAVKFAAVSGFISLIGLLILNVRMIPLEGVPHTLVYFAIAALDVFLFIRYVSFQNRQEFRQEVIRFALIPIALLFLAVVLRVTYEVKAVPYRAEIQPDEMKIVFSVKHDFSLSSNVASMNTKEKDVAYAFFIDGKEVKEGEGVVVHPRDGFQFEARVAGHFNYTKKITFASNSYRELLSGNTFMMINLSPDDMKDGKYTYSIAVPMETEPGITAGLTLAISRYDPFWEVLFH